MAEKRLRVDKEEVLRKFIISVFDSDNECNDFSGDESRSEENSRDSCSESRDEISEESGDNNGDAPGPSKRVRNTTQSDWNWTKIENNRIIYPFTENSGVCEDVLNKFKSCPPSELQIFSEYMEPLFDKICDETNAYATKQLNNPDRKKMTDDDKWLQTTADEIRAYVALVILMSQVRKSRIQLYWSRNRCIDTPIFRETIGRERFKLISRFLHFTVDSNENDKLQKIRPIIQHFSTKFSEIYLPSQNITLFETPIKFKTRLSFGQRNKRSRFGIKFYKICESSSGYCVHFRISVGDDVTDPTLSVSSNVVLNMCEPLLDRGHTLFLGDKYYSLDLCRRLAVRKTHVIETVRHNRKVLPRDVSKGMAGADLQDQMAAMFPIMRRTVKGYRKIFFYLLDMCIFNSFTVYQKITGKKSEYSDFRINIAQQLLETVQLPEYSVRGQLSSSTTPIRLQAKAWAHFPMHIPCTGKRKNVTKRCVVCYARGKRSETVWQCKKCGTALHLDDCFEVYHTQQSYNHTV